MANFKESIQAAVTAIGQDVRRIANTVGSKDLVSQVDWSEVQIIPHRGGPAVWPEGSHEGARDCVESAFGWLEVDIQQLSDGTFVCNHDATLDAMFYGMTGNVSSINKAAFRAGHLKPSIKGGNYGTPMFWSDVMKLYGGQTILVPELKSDISATDAHSFCQGILAAGLQKCVVVQSTGYNICQIVGSYGINAMYLVSALPTSSMLLDYGIGFWGTSRSNSFTNAQIASLKAAGVKVFLYTCTTQAQYNEDIARGVSGVFSNDPWRHANVVPMLSHDPFLLGCYPKGSRFLMPASGADVLSTEGLELSAGGVGLKAGPASGTGMRVLECDWLGRRALPMLIKMEIDFTLDTGAQSSAIGGVLWNNTSNADAQFFDAATTGQNGYTWVARRSGQVQMWKYTNGAAAVSLGAVPSTAPAAGAAGEFAPTGKPGHVEIFFQHDGTNVTLGFSADAVTAPQAITVADTSSMSNLRFALRWSCGGYVRNVSVTPLA